MNTTWPSSLLLPFWPPHSFLSEYCSGKQKEILKEEPPNFLSRTQKSLTIEGENDKFNYIKIKNFCTSNATMKYYSAIKRMSLSQLYEVDETRACYTEWCKLEKEKQILYINTYIWDLERWYWWTYLQGKNGDTDVENGLVDTVWEGVSGTNGESSIDVYTLLCGKWIVGEKLLYNTGTSVWCSVMTWKCGIGGKEGGARGKGYIYMADSCCCMEEANTL